MPFCKACIVKAGTSRHPLDLRLFGSGFLKFDLNSLPLTILEECCEGEDEIVLVFRVQCQNDDLHNESYYGDR